MSTSITRRRRFSTLKALLKTPTGGVAALFLGATVIMAIIGPWIWGDAAVATDPVAGRAGPSWDNLFGTDRLGRDIFVRVLAATRSSLVLSLAATTLGVLGGTILGTLPLVLGKRSGRALVATVTAATAFPGLLLAFVFAVIFGIGARGAVLGVGFAMIPGFARLTQALAFSVQGRDYVAAARIAGVGRVKNIVSHVLPNVGEPLVVSAALFAASSIVVFSSLSFLGLGVQRPEYDWGVLLVEGVNEIYTNPMAAIGPGLAIVCVGLAFNLTGESISKVLSRKSSVQSDRSGRRRRRAVASETDAVEPQEWGTGTALLTVSNLKVEAKSPSGATFLPVRGVSFELWPKETVGVVGESGSGKSLTALSISGLIEPPLRPTARKVQFGEIDMLVPQKGQARKALGLGLAVVFQDPMTSLNPALRLETQLGEVVREHRGASKAQARARAVEKLTEVGIPDPARRVRQHPHEFSGGMRQRAVIAMGLMGQPKMIVADEPTTALDVTVQRQVLGVLAEVRENEGLALLMISHDILVIGQVCDRVLVMYAGRIVEEGLASEVIDSPSHPYTAALIAAVPDMDTDRNQRLAVVPGEAHDPTQPVVGCAFAPRCSRAQDICRTEEPVLTPIAGLSGRSACWFPIGDEPRVPESAEALVTPVSQS